MRGTGEDEEGGMSGQQVRLVDVDRPHVGGDHTSTPTKGGQQTTVRQVPHAHADHDDDTNTMMDGISNTPV